MPFNRPQSGDDLAAGLRGKVDSWRLLANQDWVIRSIPEEPWIKPFKTLLPREQNVCYYNIDQWIDWAEMYEPDLLTADNYFHFMSDDCYWEYDYWQKVALAIEATVPVDPDKPDGDRVPANPEVIVTGQRRPNGCLPASAENMRAFLVTLENLCLRGDVLAENRLGHLWFADGWLAEKLMSERKKTLFVTDAFIYYNALDPKYWGYPGHPQGQLLPVTH